MLKWNDVMLLFGDPHYTGEKVGADILNELLESLGNPQKKVKFVHVAGTNGKGSACRMMQAILTESGYRTGLYISPHLEYMNERWSIDNTLISDDEIISVAEKVRSAVDSWNIRKADISAPDSGSRTGRHTKERPDGRHGIRPSAFELLTLMALVWFAEKECDIAVLEVGIGGRFDATNVIPVPECALIMNIGLEHTDLLGHTVEEIAWQKGGIIKQGGTVVLYHQSAESEKVIKEICRKKNAHLHITDPREVTEMDSALKEIYTASPSGMFHHPFSYKSHHEIILNLAGNYQRLNSLAVLDAIDLLREKGWRIPERAIQTALSTVTWPGRFEIVSSNPLVIADGAHNPNGVKALVETLKEESEPEGLLPKGHFIFVIGMMADKDIDNMLQQLAPLASCFIMETPDNERADSAEDLKKKAAKYFRGLILTAPFIEDALNMAVSIATGSSPVNVSVGSFCSSFMDNMQALQLKGSRRPEQRTAIVCCGSLFQIAAIRHYFGITRQ